MKYNILIIQNLILELLAVYSNVDRQNISFINMKTNFVIFYSIIII